MGLVNTLKLCAGNSCEHIKSLQSLGCICDAELRALFGLFKNIDDCLVQPAIDLDKCCEDFERANRAFVYFLEIVKFNEVISIDKVQPIIYEQLRAKRTLDTFYICS